MHARHHGRTRLVSCANPLSAKHSDPPVVSGDFRRSLPPALAAGDFLLAKWASRCHARVSGSRPAFRARLCANVWRDRMKYTAAERAELIDRYEKGPALLREAFAKVPREAWNWRPGAGRWSIHEILAHCADAEANAAMRVRFLVAERKPSIIGFDQERWATVLDYHQSRIELALAAVEVMR